MEAERAAASIGDLAATLDAQRFVGRDDVLDQIDRALAGIDPLRVLHLHGPGGVGKSAVLREARRRATADGHVVVALDGRVLDPQPDALRAAVAPLASRAEPCLLVLDEGDELAPLRLELRRLILDELPASTVVVIAGRRPPVADWFQHGLDRLSLDVRLPPLGPEEARELLSRAGVGDTGLVDSIVAWACGYPLALTLAAGLGEAGAAAAPTASTPAATVTAARLDELLLARLGVAELEGIDAELLDVAAVAPSVDSRLLAAVLPGRSTRAGLAALRACGLSEPIGPRVTLHRLARSALAARLKETEPARYRQLVVGVADHLRSRAETEGLAVVPELASLVENPALRLSFERSTTHYADHARPGDLEQLAAATGAGDQGWFHRMARWIAERPHQVVTVRRVTGELSATALVFTRATLPDWAQDAIEVGPVVEHAARHGRLEDALFFQDITIIEAPRSPATEAEIMRVGNAGLLAVHGRALFRYAYVTCPADQDTGLEELGYVDLPELRRADRERSLATIANDFGPAGMVGRAHDLIRSEQGEPTWASTADRRWMVDALRVFHDDDALRAVSGLDPGAARQVVRTAVDDVFADASDERLRRSLELAYLDPDGTHTVAQRRLFMSRSSFYRLLQRARQQLADGAEGRT